MATILIIDDQPTDREYLATLLADGGHRLLQVADGDEGLAIVKAEHPDLVIADILMPTMDGSQLIRRLRADPETATIPVIFCTLHYHEPEARALAHACGVAHVLNKPGEPEVVLRTVKAALGLTVPTAPPPTLREVDREILDLMTEQMSEKVNQLSIANARSAALIDLGLQLGSERDLPRLLQRFCSEARKIIGARYAIASITNGDGSVASRYFFTSGMDAQTVSRLVSPDPMRKVIATVLGEARCLRLDNPGGDPVALGFPASYPPVHSWLGAPIVSPGRVYGWFGLIDKIGTVAFSKEDERVAGILTAQLGRIYENGSLYAESVQHTDELRQEIGVRRRAEEDLAERVRLASLVGDVGVALTQGTSLKDMLDSCAQALVRHLDVAFARIWTVNESQDVLELQASAGLYTHTDGPHGRVPIGEFKIGLIAQERKPHLTNDVCNDPRVSDQEWAAREGMVAFAGYPLLVGDRLVGVMALFARQPLGPATLQAMAAVVDQIALSIEHQRAEGTVRHSEARKAAILHASLDAIITMDHEGLIRGWNPAAERIFGYSESVALGRSLADLIIPPSIRHRHVQGLVHYLATGQGPVLENRLELLALRADGSEFPVELTVTRIPVEGPAMFTGYLRDITARKNLEDQFRQAQARLQHVVASSPVVLFTLPVAADQTPGITWTSDNLPEVLGYSPAAALGQDWWLSNVHPEDRDQVIAQFQDDLLDQDRSTYEYRFRHGDGNYRWTRCEMRVIRAAAGRPGEVVGSWTDITERRRLEDQYRQAQKMEAVGQLAGGVAHDFNNLLTIINGYGELVLSELPPENPIRALIREMVAAGDRAAALTRQLLAFSRKAILEPKILDIKAVVADMGMMLRRIIGEDLQLAVVIDPELGVVKADPGQIDQVILNLVVNARDAMPQGGKLTVELQNAELDETYALGHPEARPGPYVLMAVTDTGCGMDRATLNRIFEPFFSTKGENGTGLGLATVHGIVSQSGGHVAVDSEVGQGTTFKVFLPRVEQRASSSKSRHGPAVMPRGSETVLLVEDEDGVRALSRHVLQGSGYTVLEARDGFEAVRVAAQHRGRIDLVVTDVVMPRMGGREVAERLVGSHPGVKVLFLSGYTEDAVVRHGILEAAVAFLQKPFSPASLTAKVREVLDGV